MSLDAAAPWYQFADPFCNAGASHFPTFIAVLVALTAWAIARGVGAIIGEIFKRHFFPEWWDELRKTKKEFAELKRAIEAERREHASDRKLTEDLIVENDRLLQLVLSLQALQRPRSG